MSRNPLFVLILICFSFLLLNSASAQDSWWKEKKYKDDFTRQKYALCKKTFKDIGSGLSYQQVSGISRYFDEQVYLNIISNEKGYYSSSQAELILTDFMDYFRVTSFSFKRSTRYNTYAFAMGKYKYSINGNKNELEVSISLKFYRDEWFIDQIMIN
ncbi:MAG: DUF4783 domain-containing protein [Bacteroidetes bacterium]|nr:DUF4783 domain-containing protein [Bacteroidota bacterium]